MKIEVANLIEFVRGNVTVRQMKYCRQILELGDECLQWSTSLKLAFKLAEMNVSNIYPGIHRKPVRIAIQNGNNESNVKRKAWGALQSSRKGPC